MKISSTQGFEPPCQLKRGANTELTYPLPMGIESIFVFPRHICDSKLGRGDFLARVYECFKKSVRAYVKINPHPSVAHLAWLLPLNESSCFASQKHYALWQQSALPLHWAKENKKVGVECQ